MIKGIKLPYKVTFQYGVMLFGKGKVERGYDHHLQSHESCG